jgi:alpha-tubulin suppressor-like RCC1 family protein
MAMGSSASATSSISARARAGGIARRQGHHADATGQNFSVALSKTGELYCAGATDLGQCPAVKGIPDQVFRLVSLPSGIGPIVAIKAGAYHALAQTKDGRLFAFGRGREGQLGNGRVTNGASVVEGLTNVVSFAAASGTARQ